MAFVSDSVRAQNAFNLSLDQAKTATRDLWASFGLSKQNPVTGQWSTSVPGEQFSPSNIVNYDQSTGVASVNQAALNAAQAGEYGTAFGYNRMSESMGQGAANEAVVKAALRGRGISGGGLARQAETAAESAQTRAQTGVVSELLSGLGQTYADTTSKFGDWMGSRIEAAGSTAQSVNETNATNPYATPEPTAPAADSSKYVTKGTPSGTKANPVPTAPKGGQLHTGPGGVTWQYRMNGPAGKGWYKK